MRPTARFLLPALALLLAGCEPAAPCPGDCTAAVIATGADADNLFPPLAQGDVALAVSQQIFLKLADIGMAMNTAGDSGFVPKLADSWEFEDPRTIVFRLNPAARWHDGHPVTAADVAFTFEIYRDTLVNAPSRPLLERIASVTARDDATVAFRFTEAYSEQFYDATHHMWVLPRHILDSIPRARLGSHAFSQHPVGAGPYRFVHWQPGETIELRADSTFFMGVPGIARVIWRISPDMNTALTQLIAGEADILRTIIGRESIERAQNASHLQLVEYPGFAYYYVGFNLAAPGEGSRPHPLFRDRELRRAIAFGIDRETMTRAIFAQWAKVAGGPTTPLVWIWDDDRRQLPFDSARSRQMLTDLGWEDGDGDGVRDRDGQALRFDILYPSSSSGRRQVAVLLQEQLARLGVAVELGAVEFTTFLDRLNAGRFDAAVGAWGVDPPPSAIRQYWTREAIGGSNYGRYASAEFDSLLERATRAPADEARQAWEDAITVINEDAPAVWLAVPSAVAGIHQRFHHITIRPDMWAATLWTWRVD